MSELPSDSEPSEDWAHITRQYFGLRPDFQPDGHLINMVKRIKGSDPVEAERALAEFRAMTIGPVSADSTTLRAILTELQAIRGILAAQAMQNIPDPEYPRIE